MECSLSVFFDELKGQSANPTHNSDNVEKRQGKTNVEGATPVQWLRLGSGWCSTRVLIPKIYKNGDFL